MNKTCVFALISFFSYSSAISLTPDSKTQKQSLSLTCSKINSSNLSSTPDIISLLEKIPKKDRMSLESFFRHIISYESFGYVIFGNKPMVLCGAYPRSIHLNWNKSSLWDYDFLWKNYLVWEKYQHFFPMPHYILRAYPSNQCQDVYEIIFINKKKCLQAIYQHLALFQEKLGRNIHPETILDQLGSKNYTIDRVLNKNEDLFGILLGFGHHNSESFQKRQKFYHQVRGLLPCYFDKLTGEDHVSLVPSNQENNLLVFIRFPCFLEDKNHKESQQIHEDYERTRKLLCETYSKGRFLEITLEKLCIK